MDTVRTSDVIDPWRRVRFCPCSDSIDDDDFAIKATIDTESQLDLHQPLTDQLRLSPTGRRGVSLESSTRSRMNPSFSIKKNNSSSIVLHELHSTADYVSSLSPFRWSTYLKFIDERSVSEEFFDHYLASIHCGLESAMKLEYCYDVQRDLYWLVQIQFVSCYLVRLHYLGISDEDTSNDFWTHVHGQRCHPIGWCKENSKLMLPPPMVTKRAPTEIVLKIENDDAYATPPAYLFDQSIGLTPAEQLKAGMLLELQDLHRPWTLWFVRIVSNCGGRLHLRYIAEKTGNDDKSGDVHLFYLDHRVHPVGWSSNDPSVYSYAPPACLTTTTTDQQATVDACLTLARTQFLPPTVFKEQHEIRKHRFSQGMKLEVFDFLTQHIYIARIGAIHNEYYFDVIVDNDQEDERSFVSYSTDPRLLPVHWAAEHKLALLNGRSVRQPGDYWNVYTEKYGLGGVAPDRCFNLITLNATGCNRTEPGMKLELVHTLDNRDHVFSVTITHIVEHLMWLRVDDPRRFASPQLNYHVVPINSLDVFPVGWAKFNGFELIAPLQYRMDVRTSVQNRHELFSSVTKYPRIPRVYFSDVYLLTVYVNIRCFCGPYICASRLARLPSQFGPGPFRTVLIDVFHHLLAVLSTHGHRALRRLDHPTTADSKSNLRTEHVKSAKRFSKLIRPISIPTQPCAAHHYLRHVCTQLETCPNLLGVSQVEQPCPDHCHILSNTFTFSVHSKHKRTHLRAAQNRHRKEKSLLAHLKNSDPASNLSSPVREESPGSDRQTRGFRVHIEPKTHTVTRTNKKQKGTHASLAVPELSTSPMDPRNPLTWTLNDVCGYLNESGCAFALKAVREQEIDGAALLLLDDLDTVQDLLGFKLGPAVKFYHVVEQLRSRVLDTSSRLTTH